MITTKSRIFSLIIPLLFVVLSSCEKKEPSEPAAETSSVTDVDGNVYKTIKIGNQWWMAEDLKVTKYRDGNFIQKVQADSAQWSNDSIGAFCDNVDNNSKVIGQFYNWHAVKNNAGLAPAGWHIPSDEEWKQLERALGMNSTDADKINWRGTTEGDKLKIEGPKGWTPFENVWGTNESGFTAVANGCKLFISEPGDPGIFATGFWWTSSEKDNEAWYRNLDYKKSNIFRSSCQKNYGFSVRCVKD